MTLEGAFRKHGLGYLYEPESVPIRFKVDYLSHRGDDVHAQVIAERQNGHGLWYHVHQGKLSLDGVNSKRDFAKALLEASDDEGLPWKGLVEDVCRRVLGAERAGAPIVRVGKGPVYVPPPPLVEKVVLAGIPTILFGPPGTGKGYLAVLFCVCVTLGVPAAGLATRKGRCWYLDWEDEQAIMEKRMQEVTAGLGLSERPEMDYSRMFSPLHSQIHNVAKFSAENHVDLVVIDSVEKAIGTGGEGMNYEDKAKRLFECADHLKPAAVLFIDHESWQQKTELTKSVGKAFGSYMKMAWVRAGWQARKEQDYGSATSNVALYHAKANHGPTLPPIAFHLDFSVQGAVTIKQQDMGESEELSKPLPVYMRARNTLRRGPLTTKQLAEDVGETESGLRATLSKPRYKSLFTKLPDGRWANAAFERVSEPVEVERDEDEIPF